MAKHLAEDGTFLGIEGGGTRTIALLTDREGRELQRIECGPGNLRLLEDDELLSIFRAVAAEFPRPLALGIGLAGAWTARDRDRIRTVAARIWRGIPCWAGSDLENALAAAGNQPATERRVLVLSGTGSCCYGTTRGGKPVKVGGWGHMLGDKGSAYDVGLRALKAVVYYYGRDSRWSPLGAKLLAAIGLNEPDDLIGWTQSATKTEIASLAKQVFAAWHRRDPTATNIVLSAAQDLAKDAVACARRIARGEGRVHFIFAGGNLARQPRFASEISRRIRHAWKRAVIRPLEREAVWGAVDLARRLVRPGKQSIGEPPGSQAGLTPARNGRQGAPLQFPHSTGLPVTEQRHPRSMRLDRMSVSESVRMMFSEDALVPRRVLAARRQIERAVMAITAAFRRGGRLLYVGAGTSGRLGVLDASECPPTFRTRPEMVQGIIAGGEIALRRSVEGAEDDIQAGKAAIGFRGAGRRDVVVGIAASGTTPYVWGALDEARRRRATTILVCFNPSLSIPRAMRPTIVIAPNLGPELLTGSTRLKAGTATKLILNVFSTLAMVRLGKVKSNLMIDLHPANEKLRRRAVRIVRDLTGDDEKSARRSLEEGGWQIKKAVAQRGRRRGPQHAEISPRGNTR